MLLCTMQRLDHIQHVRMAQTVYAHAGRQGWPSAAGFAGQPARSAPDAQEAICQAVWRIFGSHFCMAKPGMQLSDAQGCKASPVSGVKQHVSCLCGPSLYAETSIQYKAQSRRP